ncbi:TPA: hypothetical protein DEP90_01045 [Patescibacteria group bacterium]|nr:hypothetical protein [Patescibacteria group bacterium]
MDYVIKNTDSSYILTTKFILNYVKDLRPVLIQLANAQSNSHTLSSIEDNEEKKKIVLRNFNIHSKLAEYLGFGEIQKDITEECFRITQKDEYEYITKLYKKENITTELLKTYFVYIKNLLQKYEKEIKIQSRIKNKHSTYLKSKKYIDEGFLHPIANIKDLIGIRILTKDKDSCYKILDKIWEQGEILLDEYEDYITHPKPNGYKAMQGPIIFPKIGKLPIEIQILSQDMYEYNTYGPASHIAYKESKGRYAKASHKYDWIQETHYSIENNRQNSREKFSIPINVNIFPDKIYSLTPKRRLIALENGDTVTDFAYLVHTDIGNSMIAAKINSRATSLDHIIKTGDVVEIVTQKGRTHPKPGLLKCAHSESTKAKITRAIK